MMEIISRLAIEPQFRILARALLKHMPVSVKTRALWELSARPAYLLGSDRIARPPWSHRAGSSTERVCS